MSYLVFARKWRPLTFDDVVGQGHITSTLERAIEKNRVAHSYIFSGTRGVGKTTTARILARALNCDNGGPTISPCGTCESCKNIINGSSFDVLEIDGASNNGVDNIRELRENITYTSMGGKYRIIIIDEVHMLSKGAFNALLKTLEEPPRNVIFIFATTEPQKIPDTIHSRCQRYDFRRISTEQITEHLTGICKKEDITYDIAGIALVARRADGSMRDALSLLDQTCSFCMNGITENDVRSVLGLVENEVYFSICKASIEKQPLTVLEAIENVLSRGFDLLEFIVGFQEYLRILLFARMPGILENSKLDLSSAMLKQYSQQAAKFSEGDLLRMAELLRKTEFELKWSSYPRFLVETALLKIVYMDNTVSINQVIESLKTGNVPNVEIAPIGLSPASTNVKKKNSLAPTVASVCKPEVEIKTAPKLQQQPNQTARSVSTVSLNAESFIKQESETDIELLDIKVIWPLFLESLMDNRPNIYTFLSVGRLASTTDNSADVTFDQSLVFQFSEVTKPVNRTEIEILLNKMMGRKIALHITLDNNKKDETKDVAPKILKEETLTYRRQPSLETDIENEPIIKNVIDVFDGKVL